VFSDKIGVVMMRWISATHPAAKVVVT